MRRIINFVDLETLSALVAICLLSGIVTAQAEQVDQRVSLVSHYNGFRIPEASRQFDKQDKIEKIEPIELGIESETPTRGPKFDIAEPRSSPLRPSAAATQNSTNDNHWHFGFAPYFYLT